MAQEPEISYLEHAFLSPAEAGGSERLLVVMHGLGDSLEGYRFLPDLLRIPGLHYLLVNAPDSYFTGYSWFDIYSGNVNMERGIERSRAALFETLRELEEQGWPPEHVGVFGFSQGCLMALDVACRYPKILGGIVGVSGFVGQLGQYPEALSPVACAQKILVTHGNADPVLPIEQTKSQVQTLKGMGLQVDWRVYAKEHTIDPYNEVADIRGFLRRTLCR